MNVNDLGGRKSVEVGGRGVAAGTDIFAVYKIAQLEFGKSLCLGNGVQRIAGRPENSGDVLRALLAALTVWPADRQNKHYLSLSSGTAVMPPGS